MIETINGVCYRDMMDYGLRNLTIHCDILNNLNVFPVPDGDTGTNMVMTLQSGLRSIENTNDDLDVVAQKFAGAIIFGARGNSGVIASQFFRGISECFSNVHQADVALLTEALENGVKAAHAAVATPVEGTILTVVREATQAVKSHLHEIENMNQAIDIFTEQAKKSLENTPNLLPVLKDAGVVDSGGAGIVYFFEGVQKYLNGETLDVETTQPQNKAIDYTAYNKESEFYGYCTECLLQLLDTKEPFDFEIFKNTLMNMGDSLVTYCEEDKVRVHIHSFAPGEIMQYCQRFGEFLSVKVENMAVQHTESVSNKEPETEILRSHRKNDYGFAVVAVAADRKMGQTFLDMGADVVVVSTKNLSSEDFMQACEKVKAPEILIFPNNSNSILAAMQAVRLYDRAKLRVINCGDIAKCYASLAIIDFTETEIDVIVEGITETINNLYTVAVSRSVKTMTYGDIAIQKDDFIAMSGDDLLAVEKTLEAVVLETTKQVMEEEERSVMTVFYNEGVSTNQLELIVTQIQEQYPYLEVCTVPTEEKIYDLSISFE